MSEEIVGAEGKETFERELKRVLLLDGKEESMELRRVAHWMFLSGMEFAYERIRKGLEK